MSLPSAEQLDRHFPRFRENDPQVPVWCLTPGEGRTMHRFFDTSPLSPSGRFGAFLRFPQESRYPEPGETAQVVLVDLVEGTESMVAETAGWEPQMGANINWGGDDETLFFNDVDTTHWKPLTVCLNPHTGERSTFGRGLYHASPDGSLLACSTLEAMPRTQFGYGVVLPADRIPMNRGWREDDGLWITDTRTGKVTLALSLAAIWDQFGGDILTDTYTNERHVTPGDGSSLLRWIHVDEQREQQVVKIHTQQNTGHGSLRIDPHPAWDRSWRFAAFNGFQDKTRRVYLADFASFIG